MTQTTHNFQGWIQDFFKGGLVVIVIQLYINCNYSHYYFNQQSACKDLLCMKLQPTRCYSCSYYALISLYVCMVIYDLAWPDPSSCRGAIACSISDNAPTRTRVWPHETSQVVYALCVTTWTLQSHFFCPAIKIFRYVCPIILHVRTNSASADNVSREYKFKSLDTFLTLKHDNVHY